MRAAGAREHRVDRDDADAQVGAGERRARVEAEPAEGEDEGAEHRHRDVVTRDRAAARPSLLNLPMRGPSSMRAGERDHAADHVHHRRAGEVDVAVAEAEVAAERREPAAAPHPVAEQRVDDHRHEEAEDAERRELPALGHRAGGDRRRGVHEHHLEQEEREHADVVAVAGQEEALRAEEAERVAEEVDGELVVERRRAAERRQRADAAHVQREAADPVPEHAERRTP